MDLISSFVRETRLVSHQIDSFNQFVACGIQDIISRDPVIETQTHTICMGQITVDRPKTLTSERSVEAIYPNDARLKNNTYEGTCYANITVVDKTCNNTQRTHLLVPIAKIPIMVRSNLCNVSLQNEHVNKECSNDPGGYFIIKGKERVLIGQVRSFYNKLIVKDRCKPEEKYKYIAEIRSVNKRGSSVLIQCMINKNDNILFSLPYIKTEIPAGLLFKALDCSPATMLAVCQTDNEMFNKILLNQYGLADTCDAAYAIISQSLAGQDQDAQFVRTMVENELFYHIGELTNEKSAIHLGSMIKRITRTFLGILQPDDKNSLAFKQIDITANLLEFLFQGLYKQFVKTVSAQMKLRKNPDPLNIIKQVNVITHGIISCFMTGNWCVQKSSPSAFTRVGVSQVLSNQNYGARLSHLRRIMLPNGTKGKNLKTRQIHANHFSFLCPYETPEGENVGFVCNLALTAKVTSDIPTEYVLMCVRRMTAYDCDCTRSSTQITLNGRVVGSTADPIGFKRDFNEMRLRDCIDTSNVSIVWCLDANDIRIRSDAGRLIRPVFRIDPSTNSAIYTADQDLSSALRQQSIVFRDCAELEASVIAADESDLKRNRCDYMEICPAATMMGIMASVIPFANHSQSPRIAYQASMGKQAIGIPTLAFLHRYDTTLNVLDYPQKPLTQSKLVSIVKFNEMSHGAVPIVAIMTHCGFNQEDSIILNKSSLERGIFTAHTYKTITEEERKRGNSEFETICSPPFAYRKRDKNYTYIDENTGLIRKGCKTMLKQGDVIIGKTSNQMVRKVGDDGLTTRKLETVDISVCIKSGEEGYVDAVEDVINNDGVRLIKIRMRLPRFPEMGDKFASSAAQKGTCGMIYAQEDMPFDKEGIVPDLIINPHAIPSRMTINMLMEMAYNLIGCTNGTYPDATMFEHRSVEDDLGEMLAKLGWSSYSSVLYSGFTGKQFPSRIFMAPAFYQRLKHMVSEKIHARVAGPLDMLTHQPIAGRSREGGFRFGEMERDCILAHGSTRILKECLYDQSDKYTVSVCDTCGHIANFQTTCNTCGPTNVTRKIMPYATKLLYQELMAMGIRVKLN